MDLTHDPLCTHAALRLAGECEMCKLITRVRENERDTIWNRQQ